MVISRISKHVKRGFLGLGIGLLLTTASLTPARSQEQARAGRVPEAVQRTSQVRRLLRSACKKFGVAADADAARRSELLAAAGTETEDAGRLWDALVEEAPTSGPGPFANHPAWAKAAGEIRQGIIAMQARISEDDPGEAKSACGANCGRFVALEDASGLQLSADVLFYFRKAAQPLGEPLAEGDLNPARSALSQLRLLRDRAMDSADAGRGSPTERTARKREFSEDVDRFASALEKGSMVTEAYTAMMASLERAYDAVL